MCDHSHEHTPVVGGAKINGRWTPVSAFAGGYTTRFAKEVVKGAEEFLMKKRKRQEVFVGRRQYGGGAAYGRRRAGRKS